MVDGYLQVTEKRNRLGQVESREYKVIDGPFVLVSEIIIDLVVGNDAPVIGRMIQFGQFRFKVVERRAWQHRYLCLHICSPFWWVRWFLYKMAQPLDLIYRRLIITAAVWNLATHNDAIVPSWRDLKVVNWLEARFKHGS